MAEEAYFSDNNIRVTDTHVVILGKIYALEDIKSAKLVTDLIPSVLHLGILVAFTAAFLFWFANPSAFITPLQSVTGLSYSTIHDISWAVPIVALLFLVLVLRPAYALKLVTVSGEIEAYKSRNQSYLLKVIR